MRAWRLSAVVVLALVSHVASAAAQGGARNFLWKVDGPNGRSAFLLGSLHVLSAEYYPLSPAINQAFAQSRTLVEEVDLDELRNPAQMRSALASALLLDGGSLQQLVSAETYAELTMRAAAVGLPIDALRRMKPWFAALTLMAPTFKAAGMSGEFGVDAHFFDRAKKAGMKRQALETLAYQLGRFDQMSPALQEEMLRSTMAELDTYVGKLHELARAWAAGDTRVLERELLSSVGRSRELYDRLLAERNRNWLAHVDACLQQDSACFIVVGAAHLVGPDGLPTLLTRQGYRVTQQ
jgi:uncharacterized protein YbaP (TraB family)